jgi:hypothetical protein
LKRLVPPALILGLVALGINLMAQPARCSQDEGRSAQQQQQQQENDTTAARSFEGKIKKVGGKFVLQDSSTGQAYVLDDQDAAKKYDGKNVKVTATIDPNTNVLHVVDISLLEESK